MKKYILLTITIFLSINIAHAFIIGWNNSYSNDNSTTLSVPINTPIIFNASLNQSSNVTWYLNSSLVLFEENVTSSNFTHNFSTSGGYNVIASSEANNISWTIDVYTPLKVTAYTNNATNSNETKFEVEYGKSVIFQVNRTGTIISEFWTVNGSAAANDSAVKFAPNKYGAYNISYSVYGVDANVTLNWTVKVYLEVTDALNTTIRFYTDPGRIVSLAPSNTEMLFSVDMGSRLVGADDYSDYPPAISNMSIVRVGGPYSGISAEAIVNLTPDLVVATEINPLTTIDLLKSVNITVLTLKYTTVNEILDNILLLGKIGNKYDIAEDVAQNLSGKIENVTGFSNGLNNQRKPTLFYVVWYPELWTAGKNTYAHDLMEMAGSINTAQDGSGWFMMNKEALITKDPDVIICSGMGGYGGTVCSQIRNDSALSTLTAVKNNRMYVVSDSNIIERAGPRIVDGLEFIYEIVKDNLKPIVAPSGGGGTPAQTPKPQRTIFRESFQDYKDVKVDVFEKLKGKIAYKIRDKAAAVPLLLLNRFPMIDGIEETPQSFEEDAYEYSAEAAWIRYFFANEIIVARGDIVVDSFAALSLAKSKNIPILLTKTDEFPEAAFDVIAKIRPKKIIIVGGEKAVGVGVEEELLKNGQKVERIWGDTRVETSIEIAKTIDSDNVIVTNYDSNIEAAVSSYLYDAPIIYVNSEKLDIVLEFLVTRKPKILFIDVDESIKKTIEDAI